MSLSESYLWQRRRKSCGIGAASAITRSTSSTYTYPGYEANRHPIACWVSTFDNSLPRARH